jgi:ubiquinone/menaquinone biosynthesis C-methylase UbiE
MPDELTNPFDEKAVTWDDDPAKVARARQVAAAIGRRVPLTRSMRVLDYGAGTGLLSEALHGAVGELTLADSSAGMRTAIERKMHTGSLVGARLWDLDLSTDAVPDERFDLVVCLLTLHHITEVDEVLRAFAALLEQGGHLCIADLDEEDGSFHGDTFEGHKGFARDALARQLEAAGFSDVTFETCTHVEREHGTFPVFLAVATRGDRSGGRDHGTQR